MSLSRLLAFVGVVFTVVGGIHVYLWLRLVRDPMWPQPWGRLCAVLLLALALSVPAVFILSRTLPRAAMQPLAWLAYVWMGVMFLLLALLVPADLVTGAAAGVWRLTRGALSPERRLFLARSLAGGVGLTALGLSAVALRGALKGVGVKPVTLELPRLPAALDGFTVVQLTDIHVGPTIGKGFVESLVEKVNALEADAVAITGDLVDGSVAELGPLCAPLAGLKARHGVYFVTGNHEYYSGVDAWLAYLRTLGIRVLRNERVRIERDGAALEIAGVDDWTSTSMGGGHGPDLPRALAGRDPSVPVLLLAHQPKAAEEAARWGVDAQLSGHTHGGQIFPFNYLARLDTPYLSGAYRVGELRLYVSPGTGYWGPPMRLGTEGEITRVTLQSGASGL